MNEQTMNIFGYEAPMWIIIPVVFFLWVIIFMIIKRIVFAGIHRIAQKTKTQLDDIFIKSIDLPLNLLIFTSGGAFIEQFLPHAISSMADQELTRYFLVGFKSDDDYCHHLVSR